MRASRPGGFNHRFSHLLVRLIDGQKYRKSYSGLNALVVVPCAPNLIAFRRVSSNFERA
jgi:hypothetical protein